jgi:hypothetical protein
MIEGLFTDFGMKWVLWGDRQMMTVGRIYQVIYGYNCFKNIGGGKGQLG